MMFIVVVLTDGGTDRGVTWRELDTPCEKKTWKVCVTILLDAWFLSVFFRLSERACDCTNLLDGHEGLVQYDEETKMSLMSNVAMTKTFTILIPTFGHLTKPHSRDEHVLGPKTTQISPKVSNIVMI